VMGFFQIGSCELFAQGRLQTMILLNSASWVARITGWATSTWLQKGFLNVKKTMEFQWWTLHTLRRMSLGPIVDTQTQMQNVL
jgi:hypothetical protein